MRPRVFALAEWRFPRRDRVQTRAERWKIDVGILVFDIVAQRLTVGAAAFTTALYAQSAVAGASSTRWTGPSGWKGCSPS